MSSKARFMALAEQHGISVEYTPGGISRETDFRGREPYAAEIMLDAPAGKVFVGSGCHCDGSLNHSLDVDGTKTNWTKAVLALEEILGYGIADCPDRPDCDWCDEREDLVEAVQAEERRA